MKTDLYIAPQVHRHVKISPISPKSTLLLECLIVAMLAIIGTGNSVAQGLTISPLNGTLYYNYPISSQSINGVSVNFNLGWVGNVTQKRFIDYDTEEHWETNSRQHGMWLFGVNGFCVQALNCVTDIISPLNDPELINWLIEGYDFGNRMVDLHHHDDLRDVIKILRSDGSILVLQNEIKSGDEPESDDQLYTGNYYEEGINSHGQAIVEFDDRYYVDAIKYMIDPTGNPDVRYRPRLVRYFPGNGLEYVFREDIIPYGDYNINWTLGGSSDNGKKEAPATIFLLEAIYKDHSLIADFRYSKHYSTDASPDITWGRPLLVGFPGHTLTWGQGMITVEALGSTHQIITATSTNTSINSANEYGHSGYGSYLSMWDPMHILGYNWKHVDGMVDDDATWSSAYMVKEILSPNNLRTTFKYKRRPASINSFLFDTFILKSVRTSAGQSNISYYQESSMGYTGPNSIYGQWTLQAAEANIVLAIKNYANNNLWLSEQEFAYTLQTSSTPIDGIDCIRRTRLRYIDKLNPIADASQLSYYYYYDSTLVAELNPITHAQYGTQPIRHFFAKVERTQLGDVTTEVRKRETTPVAGNRFVRLIDSVSTWVRDGDPLFFAYPFYRTDKKVVDYDFETLDGCFTNQDVKDAFLTLVVEQSTNTLLPEDGTSIFGTSTVSIQNLDLDFANDIGIKDTTIDEYWTRRGIDSALTHQVDASYRKIITPSSAVSRDVTLQPIYGLPYIHDYFDATGHFIGGNEVAYQTLYTGYFGNPITTPRGAPKYMHLYGRAPTGLTKSSAPVTSYASSLEYSNGFFRNLPIRVTDIAGGVTEFAHSALSTTATMLATDKSTTSAIELFSTHGYFDRTSFITKPFRRYDSDISATVDFNIESFSSMSSNGDLLTSKDPNGYLWGSKKILDSLSMFSWQPGDFPEEWDITPREIRLWDAHATVTKSKTEVDCTTMVETPMTPVVEIQATDLSLRKNTALPTTPCDGGIKVRETWSSTIQLRYVASDRDNFHSEATVDKGVLKLTITDINLANSEDIEFEITWSVAGSSPVEVTEVYSFSNSNSITPVGDSTTLAQVEFDIPTTIFQAMKSSSNGNLTTITFELTSNTDDFDYISFAHEARDVAPRIECIKAGANQFLDIRPEIAESDFTSRARVRAAGLRAVMTSKLDDAYNTQNASWTASLLGVFDGRYVSTVSIAIPTKSKIAVAPMRGGPFSGTVTDSLVVHLYGLGQAHTIKQPNNYEDKLILHATKGDTIKWSDNAIRHSLDTINTPAAFGVASGDIARFMGVCRKSISYNENGETVTTLSDAWGRTVFQTVGGTTPIVTSYAYDAIGRLESITAPNGKVVSFAYDAFGRVNTITNPDFGTEKKIYDRAGRVRFEQSAKQSPGTFTFHLYDTHGRLMLTGVAPLSAEQAFEDLNPDSCYDGAAPAPGAVPITQWISAQAIFPQFYVATDEAECIPTPAQRRPDYEEFEYPDGLSLLRRVEVTPLLDEEPQTNEGAGNFENMSTKVMNGRCAVLYDKSPTVPKTTSSIWSQLPGKSKLDKLTPSGAVRNLIGRPSAVAYRDQENQHWWYKVYSYDERGLVESVIRHNENLLLDVTWYTYNSSGQVNKVISIDAQRHHTTWYSYDVEGRVDMLWTALSPDGMQYGLGFDFLTQATPQSITSTITWNAKPTNPDVTYAYDEMDRVVAKTYPNVDGAGSGFITQWDFNQRGMLTKHEVKNVPLTVNTRTDDFTLDAVGRITNKTTTPAAAATELNVIYDQAGRVVETNDQTTVDEYDVNDVDSRVQHTEASLYTTDYVRALGITSNNAQLGLSHGYSVPTPTLDDMTYNQSGQLTEREIVTGTADESVEKFIYGYHSQVVGKRISYTGLPTACGGGAATLNAEEEVWSYRYSPEGFREQRRMQQSPLHDSTACNGVLPWTYYVNDVSGNILSVYHGRQVKRSTMLGCDPPVDPIVNPQDRRVYMYPVEFRSYGPDGVNVIYERDDQGEMVKRYITTDYQGSVTLVQDAGNNYIGYSPFGKPLAQDAIRRTGYLDSETDWESSPVAEQLRSLDLVHRTYVPAYGTFTTPDPLWMLSANKSAYHYCNHDPVNNSDPWGLASNGGVAGYTPTAVSSPTFTFDGSPDSEYDFHAQYLLHQAAAGEQLSAWEAGNATLLANYDDKGLPGNVPLQGGYGGTSGDLTGNDGIYGDPQRKQQQGGQNPSHGSPMHPPIRLDPNILYYLPFTGPYLQAKYHESRGEYGYALLYTFVAFFDAVTILVPYSAAYRALAATGTATKGVGQGFNSFSAFKRAFGPAGPDQAWHHIVEQTPGNIAKFGNQAVHNTGNLMKLPHGAGTIHARVSGHYSSIQPFTNGQTVRQWMSTQSFQAQYDYGIQTLKNFGWKP